MTVRMKLFRDFKLLTCFSFISCWGVAASLVAKHNNVGVTVFVADITSIVWSRSDAVTALLLHAPVNLSLS